MNHWALALCADGQVRSVDPGAACAQPPAEAAFVWIHLDGNAPETLQWLQAHGGMPQTVVYALTAVETRPRSEGIAHGALINLRGPAVEGDDGDDRFVSIRVWVEQGRAVSVSLHRIDGLDVLREQMEHGEIRDPGDLISHLALIITKRVDPVIAELGDLVDDCEVVLEPKRAFETRRRIAEARADAIGYRRFVAPQREALVNLAALGVPWLDDDDRVHLREAADRFARMAEELEAVRERAALIHEQLTDLRSEQIENRALLLSIVALIFLPLTFITGLLGMNVEGIPGSHAPWAFDAVCALCLILALAIAAWFAAARWFKG
ncbi:zinc transporter ZntB [Sphingomonas nostoxanthinifaciens]|uniref:zinc transporter ZntB n=1 Tax=Sphingomonas nostoxanthinifaciens TaxID=2872652 RepID=UPI001CC212CF|nr:zinc transporter ZntB [Sphingomonas nostoxanthinifaciens]UAK23584.1 zinc transporter ZntB [Sphingomonas nostoxanthinifaciens]